MTCFGEPVSLDWEHWSLTRFRNWAPETKCGYGRSSVTKSGILAIRVAPTFNPKRPTRPWPLLKPLVVVHRRGPTPSHLHPVEASLHLPGRCADLGCDDLRLRFRGEGRGGALRLGPPKPEAPERPSRVCRVWTGGFASRVVSSNFLVSGRLIPMGEMRPHRSG